MGLCVKKIRQTDEFSMQDSLELGRTASAGLGFRV